MTIGCIGQGWIGKNYANAFQNLGYSVVRYGLEPEYAINKNRIADCDIVFIAVPTPTTTNGFDDSVLRAVLPLVGMKKIAVLKSTMLPGTTEKLQTEFPDLIILNSPEFLREANAEYDAAHPIRNIIGIPKDEPLYHDAARRVLEILPKAAYSKVLPARAAELVKYAGNVFLTVKVIYANILYDLADALEVEYEDIKEVLAADPRIGASHLSPVYASGHGGKPSRGAGGHCFIKDLEAFRELITKIRPKDMATQDLFKAIVRKNNVLLTESGKDLDLLRDVYGEKHELLP